MTAFPKAQRTNSDKLRRAVAALPCQSCGREGRTQAAHCNQGKGMAMKTSDSTLAALCVECHHHLDQGGIERDPRREFEAAMNLKTLRALIDNGSLIAV